MRVNEALSGFLDERLPAMTEISPALTDLGSEARSLLDGGKRVRAGFVYWGWQSIIAARPEADHTAGSEIDPGFAPVVRIAAAIELFHAAALVHDDIIDDSDTRRGRPSSHRSFEKLHQDAEWAGDARRWSISASILLGDLLLNWADDLLFTTTRQLDHGDAAHDVYRRMREEVTLGQFLDVLEEVAWIRQDPEDLLEHAQTVAIHKSAKYSVMEPLLLGAAIAGASQQQIDALAGYGLPIGVAFQMRDDLLGVFGDPDVTGKPAGDDLREGKRTVLVEIARRRLPANVRVLLDELLGDPSLDARQITMLQEAIQSSGAVERVEHMIDRAVGQGIESLRDADFSRSSVLELERLASSVTDRSN